MKNLILIAVIALSFSCKKSNKSTGNASAPSTAIVYCMSTEDGGKHINRGCATTKEEMQAKAIQYRDAGYNVFKVVEKSTCDQCN
jgi:hypothetical protein